MIFNMNALSTQPIIANKPTSDDKTSLYNEIEGLYFLLKLNRRKLMKLHRNIEHGKIRRLNIIQNEILEHEKAFHHIESTCNT
jgi:hypothetical protein